MSEISPTSRALHLLELLQARRFWPGPELADRLGVTERTLRRDVERLRTLGYHVAARRGPEGGYELATGGELPPLVFTPDEALALAAAAASSAAAGSTGEVTLTALAKLEQVMPQGPRGRVRALRAAVSLGAPPDAAPLDASVLAMLALACRDGERMRIRYVSAPSVSGEGDGEERTRRVEPAGLVPRNGRWYLVCWDVEREDWRLLRVDRVHRAEPTGLRFPPRAVPGGDAAAFVAERMRAQPVFAATIRIAAPIDAVTQRMAGYARDFTAVAGDAGATDWRIADVRLEVLAGALLWLVWPYRVLDSPELSALLADRAARFAAAS
ncbi:helix-turn-helix transcriptional regulator [Microbacterium sp. ASV49]|uniref:WYL domain-containing protein n=1 Tax=Microbacterium candidum TaxID=3041922 RepID=A0ABT7MVJ2_9MICO|nr:WYL domain-containing protein [Microbacterium sp. ASV49]MDL9978467.1 WYL domain-containing protein [Microbacterium sp. ASV49]